MQFQEIYNLLLAGKRLQLSFDTAEDAEYFRIKLAQFKGKQDRAVVELGMAEQGEIQALGFKYSKETAKAIIEFKDKRSQKQYEVVVLEEEDTATLPLPGIASDA